MAHLDLPAPTGTTAPLRALRRLLAWFVPPRSAATPEEARARRAFVQEMLDRDPHAFGCGEDVQSMMMLYPGRF